MKLRNNTEAPNSVWNIRASSFIVNPIESDFELTIWINLRFLMKYFRIIHANGYTKEECEKYKTVIYTNATSSIITIIRSMSSLNIQFQNKENNVR